MIVNAWDINGRWANRTQQEKNLNTYLKKAHRKKIDPDKPKNLAKVVTVE
mgnify:CR=1 FL=1